MATKPNAYFEAPRPTTLLRRTPISRDDAAAKLRLHRQRGCRVYRKDFHGQPMYELDNGFTYDGWIYIAQPRAQ